ANLEEETAYILGLKNYMIGALRREIPGVQFNGDFDGRSLYTVLSAAFPKTEKSEMILFSLDMAQVCVSGGSACSSGADQGSHVIRAVNNNPNLVTVRFSFSKYNTTEEVDKVITILKDLI
ncbi:MAG: aminotransferase class V-fold PLP-dependent enzyme, partial [Chitinophagaceae bacterium]